MSFLIIILLASGILELILTFKPIWSMRRYFVWLISLLVLAINCLIIVLYGHRFLWLFFLAFFSLYRLFNLYRMTNSHIQSEHLRFITRTTLIRLWFFQIALIAIGIIFTDYVRIYNNQRWFLFGLFNVILSVIVLATVSRQSKISRRIGANAVLVDAAVPTLTVAIPARNETDNLNECLISLLASDYPKLEIMVLDDQSTVQRTSEIIRSFAHAGVVFIAGRPANKGWLAKNWAYEQLLEEANGDIILFCGADTRFNRDSLRFLVSSLINRQKSVISILPKNSLPNSNYGKLFQPLRYAWEIALPRRKIQRPPVLSTCWLARRNYLVSRGGFKAVTNRVVAESYFAKSALENDGYSFFLYDGVLSDKPLVYQKETAVRLRYPQLHQKPELVSLTTLLEIVAVLGPWLLLMYGIINLQPLFLSLGFLSIVMFAYSFAIITKITYRRRILLSYTFWPAYILLDIYLLHVSMWRYEFGEILWKNRSVTSTIMHKK
jgi:glycosyltransferase involved in cell wall biosynthesis